MNTLTRRCSLTVATAVVAAVGLTACSGSESAGPLPAETSLASAFPVGPTDPVDPVMADLVGMGCADYLARAPKGAGSFASMSNVPLATAVRRNPLLTILSSALTGKLNKDVVMDKTFNGGDYTLFAPVDAAFAELPATSMAELRTDPQQLVKVLTHHLIQGRIEPNKVVGTQLSVEGGEIKITGVGDALKVDDATVLCGGIKTANATVYLIDKVLTPPR
jgi:uncharacterized surface protein with fasciclin (FAS1) repeats